MKNTKEKKEKTLQLITEVVLKRHPELKGLHISEILNRVLPPDCYIHSETVIDFEQLTDDTEFLLDTYVHEEPVFTFEEDHYLCSCPCHLGK